jgi:replicative DNA helicase
MMHAPVTLPSRTPDRVPPHNIELEQALLGAIFINNEAYHQLPDDLAPRHFFEPAHQQIFEICRDLISAGKVASPITLRSFLPADLNIGGLTVGQYLARLAAEATTVINAADYGLTIRVLAARREMIALHEDSIEACYGMTADESLRAIATAGIERLDEIASIGTYVKATRIEIGRAADEAVDRLAEMIKNPGVKPGTPWGVTTIDDVAPCLQPGNLTVVGARPGMGKTAVASSCGLRMTKRGFGVLFFSLEMTGVDIATRVIADICYDPPLLTEFRRKPIKPITYFDIARGKVDAADFDRIEDARRLLRSLPFIIDEQPALTIGQIQARARKEQQRFERKGQTLALVAVDHVHLVRASDRYAGNRVHELTEISGGLKALAKELHVPVLALCQLNRQVEARGDKPRDKIPQLSDLRDSGSIEQDADAVIFVFREEHYLKNPKDDEAEEAARLARLGKVHNRAELIIAKQRHGPTETVRIFLDIASNHVDSLADGAS